MDTEKTKLLVDLYKHEDNLLWTKIRFMLLFNSGLVVALKFVVMEASVSLNLTSTALALFGFLTSLIFVVTLHGTKRHLTAYRNEWSKQIFPESGVAFAGMSPFRLTTTSSAIFLAIMAAVAWFSIFAASIAGYNVI